MKKNRFPESLVLIFGLILIAQILTYLIPAGEFDRDGAQVVSGTYHRVDSDPLPIYFAFTAIPKGLEQAADVIFFVFIIGGVIGIIRETGSIDALIGLTIRNLSERPTYLVAGMTTLFALGSSTIGMAEEYVLFIPILVTMCLALKMDAVMAVGIVYVGAGIGYGCAALNPFTVLIGQSIAGVDLTSGQWFRWTLLAVCLLVGVHHLMRYANRLKIDPARSLVQDIDYSQGYEMPKDLSLTSRRTLVLAFLVIGITLFVYGVVAWQWYLTELGAVFLVIGVISVAVVGMSPNLAAAAFCRGASALTTTALLIGFARAIQVVLSEGMVIDTVINGIAEPLQSFTPHVAAVGMLGIQTLCNFFIPSGSGQAYVTMPIMAPLADLTGLTRQISVLAYQMGDGFTNMIIPTNALLMGMLALARVPYHRWVFFILPLLGKLYLVASVALVLAVEIGYR